MEMHQVLWKSYASIAYRMKTLIEEDMGVEFEDMSPFKKAAWGIYFCLISPIVALDQDLRGGASILCLLLDPLFLYVPLINDDINCVTVDHRLKIAALFFRSYADFHYLLRILNRVEENGWSNIVPGEIVCILPIPHVLILYFLPNMRGLWYLKMMKFLNFLLVSQYFARAFPVYKIFKTGNESHISFKTEGKGVLIVMNLCAFLLVSHVFGAFWYLFSIQRQIDCWGYAVKSEHGNIFSTSCHENAKNAAANVTRTHNFCPINRPDASVYDFGIFLYALQSGIQRSTNFSEKFTLCFSWGLRNLSSFASNLNGSAYGWENIFVVVISISGLVLFAYLLGHMQTYMQGMSDSKRIKWKMIHTMTPRIQHLLQEYSLPSDMELGIQILAEAKLKVDADFILENLSSLFSSDQSEIVMKIKSSIFMDKLWKVDGIQNWSEEDRNKMCDYLQPMMYKKGDYIIKEGEPLDMMFFVTAGSVIIYKSKATDGGSNGSSGTLQLKKDKDYMYGQELLTWAEGPSSELSNLPDSDITVKCRNNVEVFTLQDTDLHLLVSTIFPSDSDIDNSHTIAVAEDGEN